MNRKTRIFVLGFAIVALATGFVVASSYKRNARFEIFIKHLDEVTNEVVDTIAANQTAAGVLKARKTLEARKPELKREINVLKTTRASEIDGGTLARFQECIQNNRMKFSNLFMYTIDVKKVEQQDPAFMQAMKALLDDYRTIIE